MNIIIGINEGQLMMKTTMRSYAGNFRPREKQVSSMVYLSFSKVKRTLIYRLYD